MARFDARLRRLEESLLPAVTVGAIIDSLSKDELQMVSIEAHRSLLQLAKSKGDKVFARDVQLILKREEAKLPAPPTRAAKLERTRRTKKLVEEINNAKPDPERYLLDSLPRKWMEDIKRDAEEIRFAASFPDILDHNVFRENAI